MFAGKYVLPRINNNQCTNVLEENKILHVFIENAFLYKIKIKAGSN